MRSGKQVLRQVLRHGEPDSHSLLGCVAGVTKGEGGRCPTDEHRSVTGQAGAARASVTCLMCCGDRTATCLRRTCIRIATVCSSAALLSIPHLFTNPPLPPLSPFPFACMRSAIPTACLLMFCQWTGFASAHRRLPLRANPRARQCPPVSIDARLSQRSLRAPSGAATQQIGPPSRAPTGRGPTDARHSRRVHSHHGHRAAKPASAPSRVGYRHVKKDVHFADSMASRLLLRFSRQQRQRRARSLCH